jgi:hypothetical protein
MVILKQLSSAYNAETNIADSMKAKLSLIYNADSKQPRLGQLLHSDWATHTSVGKENVKDCWNGQDPEERTCMLKSMSRGSLEFVRWFRNCSFRSFDTPISCNRHGTILCNLSLLLLPQTLLNEKFLLHMCEAETVANTLTLYSGV